MMHTAELLKLFRPYRQNAIVVPGRGGRHWVHLTDRPSLDVPLGDPAMGGHAGFALGLALGILATIAEQAPTNLYHFLLDNECYATTGGQPVPNATNTAYDAMARAAGYPHAAAFTELADVEHHLPGLLALPGPVFVAFKVLPEVENAPIGRRTRWQTRTRDQVLADLRAELDA